MTLYFLYIELVSDIDYRMSFIAILHRFEISWNVPPPPAVCVRLNLPAVRGVWLSHKDTTRNSCLLSVAKQQRSSSSTQQRLSNYVGRFSSSLPSVSPLPPVPPPPPSRQPRPTLIFPRHSMGRRCFCELVLFRGRFWGRSRRRSAPVPGVSGQT